MLKKALMVIYWLSSISLLTAGFLFEEPYSSRRISLMVLIMIYCILLIGSLFQKNSAFSSALFSIAIVGVLVVIEIYSKYAVNYFFHTLYILLIFFNITRTASLRGVILSALITLVSFIKFIQLILIDNTFANVALMVFFGSVQVLVVVVGIFLKVYKEETQKTQSLYKELLETHNQLRSYAEEIKELSYVETRTLIARDLHDTLGHEMTGLIMQMEMASSYFDDEDWLEGKRLLQASKKSARQSLVKVREIVETLKHNNKDPEVMNTVEGLIEEFSLKTGCDIAYNHKGRSSLAPEAEVVLFRVIQECLTNAVGHGQASFISVTLLYGRRQVDFEIEDNGQGCQTVVVGNGLKGMEERLLEVGGSLEIQGKPSFKVWGSLPCREIDNENNNS